MGKEEPLEKQPTPVLLLGKSHQQGSLVSYSPWGHKELDTTDQLTHMHTRKNVSDQHIIVSQKWYLLLQVILTVIYILLISKTLTFCILSLDD